MPCYECVFIARQDISVPQVEALTATFADIIRAHGGQVAKTEQWGLRNLAYRIKKNKKGHYVLFNLDAPVEAVKEMERNMSLHEDVLRFMTVSVEEMEAGPSAMLRRDEREGSSDRPDRTGRNAGGFRPRRENTSSEGANV